MKSINVCLLLLFLSLQSCYWMRKSAGGGQTASTSRAINPEDVALPKGYRIEPVVSGLTFPSAMTFDEKGIPYVIEAGYSYGEVWLEPKLLRVDKSGKTSLVAKGGKNGPWTGVTYHRGNFYVAEGGHGEGGKILRITPEGKSTVLTDGLPSFGDHHTNGPVVKDGYVYFGQGTATNSGVVGNDNADFGWLKRHKDFCDIPCRDVTLLGNNYETDNIFTAGEGDKISTGAFSPYGTSTSANQVIKGRIPCTGSVMRIPLEGGKPELVAWGLRNPFGMAVYNDKIYLTENGFDDRGSRPVWGTADVLWEIKEGAWYGWPDFSAGKEIKDIEEFHPPGKGRVKPLLAKYPMSPPKPVAIFGVHSSSNGLDFSRSDNFGYKGNAFVAQFGDMAPKVGKVVGPVGFKVIRVDIGNGFIEDFAVNRNQNNGPASLLKSGGLERPVSVKFSPDGTALYIVDFGVMNVSEKGPQPQQRTGMIWKVSKQ
jgi:glucose/arabinose dehydrogenase